MQSLSTLIHQYVVSAFYCIRAHYCSTIVLSGLVFKVSYGMTSTSCSFFLLFGRKDQMSLLIDTLSVNSIIAYNY